MRYVNYLDFNIHQITLFLSLAENLNYTKTAKQCNVTQSTLSKVIIQLEQKLGIQLFIRDTSNVKLTPAGRSLYKDFKELYGNIAESVETAFRIQQGKVSNLNIGINDGLDIQVELLPFLKIFQEKYPYIELRFRRDVDQTLWPKLKDRTHDIIFDFTLKEFDEETYNVKEVFTGPLVLYMLQTNPLCAKEALTIADLQSQSLLVRGPSHEPEGIEMIRNMLIEQSIEPLFSTFVANAQDLSLNILDDNQGILADGYYIDRYNPTLTGRPIENTKSSVWLRWHKGLSENKDVDLFAEELIAYFCDE